MKRVLFVLLCAVAIFAIPACKHMTCKKETAELSVPEEPAIPAPAPAVPAEIPAQ